MLRVTNSCFACHQPWNAGSLRQCVTRDVKIVLGIIYKAVVAGSEATRRLISWIWEVATY